MSRLSQVRKTLAGALRTAESGLNDVMAYSLLEGAVLGVFDCFELKDIHMAIRSNVDLWDADWEDFEDVRTYFKALSKERTINRHGHLLTTENIIAWLMHPEARPDLANLIVNTPGGLEWLDGQVKRFREVLLSGSPANTGRTLTPIE